MQNHPDQENVDHAHATGVGLGHWGADFPTTHWTALFDPGSGPDHPATKAIAGMGGRYWYPLYAYLRRQGYSSSDAQDYTQGFFAYLLSGDRLRHLQQDSGRFRSYLPVANCSVPKFQTSDRTSE